MVCIVILVTTEDTVSGEGVDRDTHTPTSGVDMNKSEKHPGSDQPGAPGYAKQREGRWERSGPRGEGVQSE